MDFVLCRAFLIPGADQDLWISDTSLCLHSRNKVNQAAQMESRNANRGLWKRKLKITEQLKENKQGFIGNNCPKKRKKSILGLRRKKMRRHKNKPDENLCKENKKEVTILWKIGQENRGSGQPSLCLPVTQGWGYSAFSENCCPEFPLTRSSPREYSPLKVLPWVLYTKGWSGPWSSSQWLQS